MAAPTLTRPGTWTGSGPRCEHLAGELDGFYQYIAVQVGPPVRGAPPPADVQLAAGISAAAQPGDDGLTVHHHPHALWVREHLHHLAQHVPAVAGPARHVAELRRTPWWRGPRSAAAASALHPPSARPESDQSGVPASAS